MLPYQKILIVREYAKKKRLTVGMCGDGGNDSGALRTAHAGLALSARAEASVAAPFSTDDDSLLAVVRLLREGRTSLCTSFATYRWLVVRGIMYSLTKALLQALFSGVYYAPLEYLYVDLVSTPFVLWGMSLSLPAETLAPRPPEGSLFGPFNVLSGTLSTIIGILSFGIFHIVLSQQMWFQPFDPPASLTLYQWQDRSDNFESSLTFLSLVWFYVDLCLIYSYGHIHRTSLLRNKGLLVVAVGLISPILIILFSNSTVFSCFFKVNCSSQTFFDIRNSWINYFLFEFEQVGGTEWFGPVEPATTNFPTSFKVGLLFGLIALSIVHHVVFRWLILGPFVQEYLPTKGWNDGFGSVVGRKLKGTLKLRRLQRKLVDRFGKKRQHKIDLHIEDCLGVESNCTFNSCDKVKSHWMTPQVYGNYYKFKDLD